jgi:hypothetical protein
MELNTHNPYMFLLLWSEAGAEALLLGGRDSGRTLCCYTEVFATIRGESMLRWKRATGACEQ